MGTTQSNGEVYDDSSLDETTGILTYRGGWLPTDGSINKLLITHIIVIDGVTALCGESSMGRGGCFMDLKNLVSIEFESDSCTQIHKRAFDTCTSLTTCILPSTCTIIGPNAFAHCESLTTFGIPEGMRVLGDFCFVYCYSLMNLKVPNNCAIHREVFSDCTSLHTLSQKHGFETIDQYVRSEWRLTQKLADFKYTVINCWKVMDERTACDPRLSMPDMGMLVLNGNPNPLRKKIRENVDKNDVLYVLYDRITSDDVRRYVLEFLDYSWMDF